ncbi:hypothetical protein JM18_005614 [Phytophthora kernoviae]|uniref:Uncharacterized protein n=1 Tax=Phytophthora kernoviae TaxID=325452 RepID=A0A921SG69_9STRA|nr:hypothetical protein JM18_005614 [Phytophthora kernoviae]
MSNIYITEPATEGKVLLHTSFGDLDVELWPQQAPKACRNFVQLCLEGYYDQTIFHRIIAGFMVQGGDPTSTGNGGESIYDGAFIDEFHSRLRFNHRGLLAMANENKPNTNHSQFFFTLDACDFLDKKHTIFGKITGNTIFNLLSVRDLETDANDHPTNPPKFLSAEVLWNPFEDIVPRATKHKPSEVTVEEVQKKKKRERKATKDLKLLSFGDEEEAFQEEIDGGSKKSKKKKVKTMLSSHDLLDDRKLKSEVDSEVLQKITETNDETTGEGKKEEARANLKAAVAAASAGSKQAHSTTKAQDQVEPKSEGKHGTFATGTMEWDADKKRDREEYAKLRDELRKSRKAVPLLMGEEAKKQESDRAFQDMLTPLQQQRQKYLQRKKAKSRSSREQDTLSKLKKFQAALVDVNSKQPAKDTESDESSEDSKKSAAADKGYHGQVLEGDDDDDDTNEDKSWMTAKLKFKKHIDDQFRSGNEPSTDLKVVYFVRHGQGFHNEAIKNYGSEHWYKELVFSPIYKDADLTPLGIRDAQAKGPPSIKAELERAMPPIERVVVSPVSRAIQTAQNFFAKDQVPDAPFVCMEGCRERLGIDTCNNRRTLSELRTKFPDVDFSAIEDEEDVLWTPTRQETDEEIQTRAKAFLSELFSTVPERHVAVVTHFHFIQAGCTSADLVKMVSKRDPNQSERLPVELGERTIPPNNSSTITPTIASEYEILKGNTPVESLEADEKCRFLFEMFDVEHRGVLSKEGVRAFIEATFAANGVNFLGEFDYDTVVDKIFDRCRQHDKMTYGEFKIVFAAIVAEADDDKSKGALERLSVMAETQHQQEMATNFEKGGRWYRVKAFCRKYNAEIFWLTLYFMLMIGVFIAKASRFAFDPAVGNCPRIAKGFAEICLVNTMFVLLPMCRNFVTGLRTLPVVVNHLPVDQHVEFHKICGVVLLIASVGHTAAWLAIVIYVRTVSLSVWEESAYHHLAFVRDENLFLFALRVPIWTGVVMLLCAGIAAPLCMAKIRRGKFNLFWVSHMLFVPFLVLMAFHGFARWVAAPQAHYWVLPPIVIYLVEKRYRMAQVFGGKTTISQVQLSKEAVAIFMKKPKSFGRRQRFLPGMYVFINVPTISKFEWHPFTISSAPEDKFLSLHIQRAGDWTDTLYNRLAQLSKQHEVSRMEDQGNSAMSLYPTIYLDGPIGAPAQDYACYREVILIGAGIGVTPFASILRSIMHQWESFRCPHCKHIRFPPNFQLRKIYFYWVTREQESLTWFTNTMNQLSEMDSENRLEIHNFYSAVKSEAVIAPLQALQDFIHNTEGQDIISGLHTKQKTHFGRPDWKNELTRVARNHRRLEPLEELSGEREEIGVFFCGPKTLGNVIDEQCMLLNQAKVRQTPDVEFDFHSENF